jgi:hypothetical protein
MIELVHPRKIDRKAVQIEINAACTSLKCLPDQLLINESPWMPLEPELQFHYPEGVATNRKNVHLRKGCDSVLSTITVEADGFVYACCGLGMTAVPELRLGSVGDKTIAGYFESADDDLLKHWIRAEGPERILAWAADHDPAIEWEDLYAHKCQACIRLYKDPAVRQVIVDKHEEVLPDIIALDWMLRGMQDPRTETEEKAELTL